MMTRMVSLRPSPAQVELDGALRELLGSECPMGRVRTASEASGRKVVRSFTKVVQRIPVKIVLDPANPLAGALPIIPAHGRKTLPAKVHIPLWRIN